MFELTHEEIKRTEEIIKSAGSLLLNSSASITTVKEGTANYVTDMDIAIQNYLETKLSAIFPEAEFLAEEDDESGRSGLSDRLTFIIDPIDGTTNFIRNLNNSSVSVGICYKRKPVAGFVLQPYTNEFYTAFDGKGAYLNGNKITVSGRSLKESLVGIGTSPYYRKELASCTSGVIADLFPEIADFRRLASAAQDLCLLASGKIDAFFEYRLSPWDYAAGMIIVNEAGGIITDLDGNPPDLSRKSPVICGNTNNYDRLLEICRNNYKKLNN